MKLLKRIALLILLLVILSLIGGYFYFDKKFTPPQNALHVTGISGETPLKWVSTDTNLYSALLLPVVISGINGQVYMQLDFGSPNTFFYKKSLQSIGENFLTNHLSQKSSKQISLTFSVSDMQVASEKFGLINYGKKIDFSNSGNTNVVGTIGTDLLEKRVTQLDFKNNVCSFSNERERAGFSDLKFRKRRILLPAKIGEQDLKLMYDSGTSGYELITSKDEWENYKLKDGNVKTENGNSWGNVLSVITAPASRTVQIANTRLRLSEVTYIEGTSRVQNLLMQVSGMQGMIGNKLFLGNKLTLDCKNEKFRVD